MCEIVNFSSIKLTKKKKILEKKKKKYHNIFTRFLFFVVVDSSIIFYYFILTYKELILQKLRKYCDNLLYQYFIILKLKKNTVVAQIYIYKIKNKVKVSNQTGHLKR